MMGAESSEMRPLIDTIAALQEGTTLHESGGEGLLVVELPQQRRVVDVTEILDRYRPRPRRVVGEVRVDDLESLVGYVERFKRPGTALWVLPAYQPEAAVEPRVVAELDYHVDGETPEHRTHSATMLLTAAPEWQRWRCRRDAMSQFEFANFIEDGALDLVDPEEGSSVHRIAERIGLHLGTVEEVMAASRGIALTVTAQLRQQTRLADGAVMLQYMEGPRSTEVRVPGLFAVQVPVFEAQRGERWLLPVRLRYSASEGQVAWTLVPHGVDLVQRAAAEELRAYLAEATNVPVWVGRGPVARKA